MEVARGIVPERPQTTIQGMKTTTEDFLRGTETGGRNTGPELIRFYLASSRTSKIAHAVLVSSTNAAAAHMLLVPRLSKVKILAETIAHSLRQAP